MTNTYGKIENGVIINVEVHESSPSSNYICMEDYPSGFGIGDLYDASTNTLSKPIHINTLAENYNIALQQLATSDWTQGADANLTQSNLAQWVSYRATLRAIAITPIAGNLDWPVRPKAEYNI